ncbi:hypothetical protein SEA_MOLEFICENT_12 [Microbacterium phage Moleficent]|uniref:Uncharacterized protein n=5 Tax=Akonivirus phedro TaxID=2845594 RepID=A0A6M3TBW3_9CAUD|nr:hypothetical protein HWD33_gp12 [Microbacterium phage Phedro]QFG04935.1 hypothetical protein SEA_PHRIEDRICE_12 [Microbacterium phage PhriedRice]QJD52864.1 hypothetical protein SEA_PHRACTURED_12 [Microbacterium phage Phractured]QJD52974.1 hypothetical protein SEA_PHARKY_12 [Microbacterium phage Pharky]QWY82704.1 hypothetical protein SEA_STAGEPHRIGHT_12 [Microbacterium phage StagePhright]UXE04101.1 hypothetical protein Fullmetal_12 [Microbacterium phage Fullmetal]WNM74516.1 hypothetical prot
MSNKDPRYNRGNLDAIDAPDMRMYVFIDRESETVRAAYSSDGQYDAFFDFEQGYMGSSLSDVNGTRTTYEQWFLQNAKSAEDYPESAFIVEVCMVDKPWDVEPYTGLSIESIRESAFAWLAAGAREINETRVVEELLRTVSAAL